MGKNQHVVPRGEHGWAVLGAGNQRDTSHHSTQEEARLAAREIAMNQKSLGPRRQRSNPSEELLRQRSLPAARLSEAPPRTAPLLSGVFSSSRKSTKFPCQCAPANKV